MTSSIIKNKYIPIHLKNAVEHQKQLKVNRWLGYNIRIIKDSKDALQVLQEVLLRRKIHRNMMLGVYR